MPFAVIETVNDAGKVLSVVPDKWLRSSKSGSIVLWPNIAGTTEEEEYFRDEGMCPQKSWLKIKCTVKRYPIGSYERATSALKAMSDGTEEMSSDASYSRKRPPPSDLEANGAVKKLAVENSRLPNAHQNGTSVKSNVGPSGSKNPVLRTNEVPLASPGDGKDSLPVIISVNSENVAYVVNDMSEVAHEPANHQMGADNSLQKCLNKMNEILGLQHLINARLDQLEQKVSIVSEQNKLILSAAKTCCKRSSDVEETLSFVFEPMENEQQLVELEQKLEDNEYKTKMIKWLRLNVGGDCTEDRMLGVLDALFTKKFQTMCTWTGISRKGPKTAVMPNRNILEIFQIIGSGESDEVNQRELANFFMKKLKNSLKRLHLSGLRRATRHIRRTKSQIQPQTDDLCDNSDSSSHSEADPESYTGYNDDSGSSDVEVLQHNSAEYPGEVPSTSECSFDTFSIVKIE